jgi:hypothetical protein
MLEGICHAFPVVLTQVAFTPVASRLPNALGGSVTYQVLGTFNACGDPTTLFIFLWNKVVEHELKTVGINLDAETWKLINDETKALFAGVVKDFIETILRPFISDVLAVQLQAVPPQQLSLAIATIALQSTATPVASPIADTLQIQPQGPGLTTIYADLGKFLLGAQGSACDPTSASTNVQGNAASLTIDGPPITMPTGSGATVGLVPVTTGTVTIEKGYVPIPNSRIVGVVDAGAAVGGVNTGSPQWPLPGLPFGELSL